jgi:hypothetical protein
MFEIDEDYRKARKESKDKITKIISVWSAREEAIHDSGFHQGVQFGYNKANKWHDINDIEPSKEQLGKQLLIRMESVIGDTDYDYLVYKYSGESITDVPGVIAWKEIE